MNEVLMIMKDCYNLVNNSINLQPIIGLDFGLMDFFLAVLVLYTVCKIIMSGLFDKFVDYVNSPTEEEKFHQDVENARYRMQVGRTAKGKTLKVLKDDEV